MMQGFIPTANDYYGVLPLIILAGTGLIVLLWDAFEKRPSRSPLLLAIIGALAAGVSAYYNVDNSGRVFSGMILNTGYSHFYTIVFSLAAVLAILLAERYLKEEEVLVGEFSALVLFSACGMVMLASANDLIITFLGLETMSIAFYVLAGLFRRRRESNEAALKYFLLGAFATGFFLYGIALIYGTFGTTNLDLIQVTLVAPGDAVRNVGSSPMLWMGIALLLIGFCFKIAIVPFHQWAPDVYEGAPTVVSGFMSTAGKAGAFAALIYIFNVTLGPLSVTPAGAKITNVLALLALISMYYGNITALAQTRVKRMLAYSSIAHAGYMLLGVAAMSREGADAVTIYLTIYTLMQLGAFGVVAILEKESGAGLYVEDYLGLAKRRPWLAFMMAVMMLSLAGIPPFAGFFGKYYLFTAAISSGLTVWAVLGIIASLISVYFYLRIIVLMYFREKEPQLGREGAVMAGDGTLVAVSGQTSSWIALGIAGIGLLVLGLLPMILTNLSKNFFAP